MERCPAKDNPDQGRRMMNLVHSLSLSSEKIIVELVLLLEKFDDLGVVDELFLKLKPFDEW